VKMTLSCPGTKRAEYLAESSALWERKEAGSLGAGHSRQNSGKELLKKSHIEHLGVVESSSIKGKPAGPAWLFGRNQGIIGGPKTDP